VRKDEPAPAEGDADRADREDGPGRGGSAAIALRQHGMGEQTQHTEQTRHQPEGDRLVRAVGREEGRHARKGHQVGEIEQPHREAGCAEPDQPCPARAAAQVPAKREHHPGDHEREDLQP
jgi:hypothetical protein